MSAPGYRFTELATYNSEVARGIAHTPEWVAKMAAVQVEFDDRLATSLRTIHPDSPGVSHVTVDGRAVPKPRPDWDERGWGR